MFITFEGPEGSGKSTQIDLICKRFEKEGIDYVRTFEPGGTELGARIRKLLLFSERMSEKTELLLYAADRSEHVETVIKPALADGKVVICDRFYHSTLAYQGYGRGIELSLIYDIMETAVGDCEPDMVFLLDLPVERGFSRISSSGRDRDRIENEKMDFHRRLREGYLEMAGSDNRFVCVDADSRVEKIHNDIWEAFQNVYKS